MGIRPPVCRRRGPRSSCKEARCRDTRPKRFCMAGPLCLGRICEQRNASDVTVPCSVSTSRYLVFQVAWHHGWASATPAMSYKMIGSGMMVSNPQSLRSAAITTVTSSHPLYTAQSDKRHKRYVVMRWSSKHQLQVSIVLYIPLQPALPGFSISYTHRCFRRHIGSVCVLLVTNTPSRLEKERLS